MRKTIWLLAVLAVVGVVFITDYKNTYDDTAYFVDSSIDNVSGFYNVSTNAVGSEILVVSKVLDGDTLELMDGRRVRYIGIDAPEKDWEYGDDDCYAEEAMLLNQYLVLAKPVTLVSDQKDMDEYGRLLRYVYIDDIFVNDYLVQNGAARTMTIPPDTKYADQLRESEIEAKKAGLGIWGKCFSNR